MVYGKQHGWINEEGSCLAQGVQQRLQEHYGYALEGDQESLCFLSASWVGM